MQCFTPMVRFYQKVPEELKAEGITGYQRIVPRHEVFSNLKEDENYLTRIQDKNYELEQKGSEWRYQLIPCRHCWACQLKYSAEWATRLTWESKYHKHKYYITLTYDEEHVPIYEKFQYIDKDGDKTIYENDGTWTGTLEPKDVTRFIKALRKHFENKGITGIKYFYCGEYGNEPRLINGKMTMGYRPHYHMILFGAPLDLNQFYDFHIDPKHKKLHWKSKEIEEWWSEPRKSKHDKPVSLGMVDIGEVEWNNCAYVARYCMKKLDTENDGRIYAEKGKIKEFIRMSRRPGIGMQYYEDNKDHIYETDSVVQKTIGGNISTFKPPKAFDKKYEKENPEIWAMIKESRLAAAERNRLLKKELTKGISDLELLHREAEKTINKGQMLKRVVQFD